MITCKVKNVKLFTNEKSSSVKLVIDKQIDGFIINEAKECVEAKVDNFSINSSAFTAQLCACCDEIAMYRASIGSSFNQKQLALILYGAELTIERELVSAGEVKDEHTFERDCYTTKVVSVELTDVALAKLDKACEL